MAKPVTLAQASSTSVWFFFKSCHFLFFRKTKVANYCEVEKPPASRD